MPSTRSLVRLGSLLAVPALAGVAAAQSPDVTVEYEFRLLAALVVNLLLGGALVALGPRYADATVRELREDPAGAFGWGLLVGIGGSIAIALLAITIIGLVVALPAALVLAVVALVGNAVTVLWVGNVLVGTRGEVGPTDAAVGAVALALPMAIPILGDLVARLVGFFGIGVVGRSLYESWR